MFDDDDPVLARIRELALELPGGAEKVSHGRPAFFTKKVFAYYGGSVRHEREWIPHDRSLIFLPDPADRLALVEDGRVFVPAYLGASDWLGIDLHLRRTDWTEVAELLDASFRLTAPKTRIAELGRPHLSGRRR